MMVIYHDLAFNSKKHETKSSVSLPTHQHHMNRFRGSNKTTATDAGRCLPSLKTASLKLLAVDDQREPTFCLSMVSAFKP
jgi:hypothetical protein